VSSNRRSNRKRTSKRASATPESPARTNRPKSRTADYLKALLDFLDKAATPTVTSSANGKSQKASSSGNSKSSRKKTSSAKDESSFMQELARLRDDLHKEQRSRVAVEAEAEALRQEVASLQRRIEALDTQRRGLQTARVDLETQLDAEQRQREFLIDQLDAINARLTATRSRSEKQAAELGVVKGECESLTGELVAAQSAHKVIAEELQTELQTLVSQGKDLAQERDALQAAAQKQQSEIAALTELARNAEAALRERDELIEQFQVAATEFEGTRIEWQERFRLERETRERTEQELFEQVARFNAATAEFETTRETLLAEGTALREHLASKSSQLHTESSARSELECLAKIADRNYQDAAVKIEQVSKAAESQGEELSANIRSLEIQLADANSRLISSAANEQLLSAERSVTIDAKREAIVLLAETRVTNERLERRVGELEAEVSAGNRRCEQDRDDLESVNEHFDTLQNTAAKMRKELAESHEQLAATGVILADAIHDRDVALQRAAEVSRRADKLSDEVKSLQASVQREAAARRKAEGVHKREAGNDPTTALFDAEQKIERLSRELASSKSLESAYQQRAARKVQQVKQELDSVRQRLAELEQRPESS
jgi:chromosome segregation ATPase